ncbi:MAG: hypothetical protein NWE76_10340 [Candidatus Bathyarchaeota archaeon]|nr:hypothetical protein [Candidatus Bathyarchaeota archaeon]
MKTEIAVVTVSGKAYFRLVNELKQRRLLFLSLVPGESIPPSIKVAITTEEERTRVEHPTVLVYDEETDPSQAIDEAMRRIQKKEVYEEVTIGVDPGKTFGVAVLGDGKALKRLEKATLEMAIDTILTELKKNPAKVQNVKIGDGIPGLAEEIAGRLGKALPEAVGIQIVGEEGTSSLRGKGFRRKMSNADSAVRIAGKNSGVQLRRKEE